MPTSSACESSNETRFIKTDTTIRVSSRLSPRTQLTNQETLFARFVNKEPPSRCRSFHVDMCQSSIATEFSLRGEMRERPRNIPCCPSSSLIDSNQAKRMMFSSLRSNHTPISSYHALHCAFKLAGTHSADPNLLGLRAPEEVGRHARVSTTGEKVR